MIKKLFLFALVIPGLSASAQVGINCQYVPGLQFGSVRVKTTSSLGTYHYGAGLPLMMIDRVGNKWYMNLDMNALYYGATQANKAADNRIKIAKTEGGYFAGRLGRVFGKGDQSRIGFNVNLGYSTSNLDSARKTFDPRGYMNLGAGIIFYKKFGKIRFVAKAGYEKYSAKKFITKGSGTYLEATIGYMLYQKYGISVMPCLYSKKFDYKVKINGVVDTNDSNAKVSSFVLRVGIAKFL